MLVPASHEFTELCEAQVMLMAQAIGAAWSAVYLTEKWIEAGQPQLCPIATYPDPMPIWETPEKAFAPPAGSLAATTESLAIPLSPWEEGAIWGRRQLILPLVHQEVVLGLLVTRRRDRAWNDAEIDQIRHVTHTLAVACFLDQHSQQLSLQLDAHQQAQQQRQSRIELLFHQLRSPLTALRTLSKVLLKRLLPGDRNHSVAESLMREGDRLRFLLEQLEMVLKPPSAPTAALTAAAPPKLLAGADTTAAVSFLPSAPLQLTTVDVGDLLQPLFVAFGAIAQQQAITLTTHAHDPLLPVQADAIALREVFSNLLDNAIKYTPPGGQVHVEVGLETERELGIAIQDNGPGIPPADQDHIFERHYRGVQAEGAIPGTGLGLAIVRDLLEQMHSRITLISPNPEQQKGTTFIVWLPLA